MPEVSPYLKNTVWEFTNQTYQTFMTNLDDGKIPTTTIEELYKTIAKEIHKTASKRNIIFTGYGENKSVDELHESLSQISTTNLYADEFNGALDTGLSLVLFLPLGIAKLAYKSIRAMGGKFHDKSLERPSKTELLNLKKFEAALFNAYQKTQ